LDAVVAPCPVGNLTVTPDAVNEQVTAVAPVTTTECVPPSLILLSVIAWQFTLVIARLLSPKSMVAQASDWAGLVSATPFTSRAPRGAVDPVPTLPGFNDWHERFPLALGRN